MIHEFELTIRIMQDRTRAANDDAIQTVVSGTGYTRHPNGVRVYDLCAAAVNAAVVSRSGRKW